MHGVRSAGMAVAGGVMSMLFASPGARAQVITRVDLDNDSFNFWQSPKMRADREYSQGTRIAVLRRTDGRVVRRLLGRDTCQLNTAIGDCRMLSWALTQAIYTPTLNARTREAGERPYAGWLGVELGAQRERQHALRAFAVGIGVTGAPSLAAPAQKAVHRIFRFQKPQGWEAQLPTEVAMLLSYRGARELLHVENRRSGIRLRFAPVWQVQAGSVVTDATIGAQLTAGLRPPAPWRGATNMRGDRWSLFVRAGAEQSAVARNLFLDGSTFVPSERVDKHRFVGQTDLGIGIRAPIGLIEWQVHSRGREYRMQPRAHAYSTLSFALR